MGWFTRKRDNGELPVFKAIGNGYWYACFTNAFQDRDGEILSEDAQKQYVRRVKAGLVPMPELWTWHTEGTRHGVAIMVERVGKSLIALGKFDDTPAGRAAEKFYARHGSDIALSHGFMFPMWARTPDGVYKAFNTFEISTLPRGKEANPYTTFEMVKEANTMPLSDERVKFIRDVLGKAADTVLSLVDDQEQRDKALEDSGVKFKEFVDLPPTADEDTVTKAEFPPAEDDEDETVEGEVVTEEVTEAPAEEPAAEVTEEPEAEAPEPEDEKADEEINSVLGQIVEGQGVLMEMLTALSDRLNTVETESAGRYEKAEARIKELEGLLEVGKIKASSVQVSPAEDAVEMEAAAAAIKAKQGPGDYDPMFPGLKIPRR
jgi:hypothetical protein